MSKQTQFNYSVENAIFNFIKNENVDVFCSELDRIQNFAKTTLMVRFGKSTILYTFNEIKKDIQLPKKHQNYQLMMEMLMPYAQNHNGFTDLEVLGDA